MTFHNRCAAIHSIAILLSFVATTSAQDATADADSPLVELRGKYDEAMKVWDKKYSGLRTEPSDKLIERYDTWPGWWFLPRIVKLGATDPQAPYAFDALKWAAVEVSNGVGTADRQYYPYDEQVFAALRKDHLSNPQIASLFENSSRYPTEGREKFLRECGEKGSTREVRGIASYYLVDLLRHKREVAARLRTPGLDARDPFQTYVWNRRSPGYLSYLGQVDAEKTLAESEAISQRIIDEYGDVQWPEEHLFALGKPTLAFMARLQRAQSSAVQVGEPVPDLAGKDLAGVEQKLTDYRGKVVVLHFWATFLPPGVEKIPQQLVELSKKHDSTQLCILGINLDRSRQDAVQFVKENRMAWPSWCASDIGASLGRLMPVGSWPQMLVLDHKGVLRYRDLKGEALDKAVESLLQELPPGEPQR